MTHCSAPNDLAAGKQAAILYLLLERVGGNALILSLWPRVGETGEEKKKNGKTGRQKEGGRPRAANDYFLILFPPRRRDEALPFTGCGWLRLAPAARACLFRVSSSASSRDERASASSMASLSQSVL